MAKKTHVKVRLVPESKPDSSFFYYAKKPTKGEKTKNKLNTIVFELDKINPTYQMAVDILIRLEKEIKKSNRNFLVEELKNNTSEDSESALLKNISKIDKEILDLKNKYNE